MNILLVEDNQVVVDVIQAAYIRPHQHACVNVQTRQEAIAAAGVGKFDAIILDLNLPDSKGWDTLVPVKAAFRETPLVILTAYLPEGDYAKAIRLGADAVLEKGYVTATAFDNAVKAAIERPRHPLIDKAKAIIDDASSTLRALQATG